MVEAGESKHNAWLKTNKLFYFQHAKNYKTAKLGEYVYVRRTWDMLQISDEADLLQILNSGSFHELGTRRVALDHFDLRRRWDAMEW